MPVRLRLKELVQETTIGTLKELCVVIDAEYQTVYNWNQGRSLPNLKRALELCYVLGCAMEDLIEFDTRHRQSTQHHQTVAERGLDQWVRYVHVHRGNPSRWNQLVQLTLHQLL